MDCRPVILLSAAPLRQPAGGDNCACPDSYYQQNEPARSPITAEGKYLSAQSTYSFPLDAQYTLFYDTDQTGNIAVLNQAAVEVLRTYRQPRSMHGDKTAAALAEAGLLRPAADCAQRSPNRPVDLVAWIQLTNACNLACGYCFQPKDARKMTETTGKRALDALFRSASAHGLRQVTLKYAGGEPSLHLPLLRKMQEYARSLAEESGIDLRASILSNGVLLDAPKLLALRALDVHVMISLDGPGAHERQRPMLNGKGSFASAARAVDTAVRLGMQPCISITVTRENAASLAEMVHYCLDQDLSFTFNLVRESDPIAGAYAAESALLIAGLRDALHAVAQRLPRERVIDRLFDLAAFHHHDLPCGAGYNYLVVDTEGRIARCQMEMYQPCGDIFHGDPLTAIQTALSSHPNLPVDQREGCRECPWRYACAGGCALQTYRAYGRADVRSPNCEVYQAIYPELLRIEGLRMLRSESARSDPPSRL